MASPPVEAPKRHQDLKARIVRTGEALSTTLEAVVDAVPGKPRGPGDLARRFGIDKVLASRVLKAARNRDPLATLYESPGPQPLRRVLRSAASKGVPREIVAAAEEAVDRFEELVRHEAGDRSALDAIISAWLPEARRVFELRRKQAVFRAMSQLKGSAVDLSLGTVLIHPADDGATLDVVWLFGLFGLQRLRPGAPIKLTSRRIVQGLHPRHPQTLDGRTVEDLRGLRLDDYCSQPEVELDVHDMGEVVRYMLADPGYGPAARSDLVFAEVNRAEMERFAPPGSTRKGYFFTEVTIPARGLLFDVLVHKDVYPSGEPALVIYDTVSEGVASVNDRSRDFDRLDMLESVQPLGVGFDKFHFAALPSYVRMLQEVSARLGWQAESFRGYRCAVDYPIYGSQVTMAFDPPVGQEE